MSTTHHTPLLEQILAYLHAHSASSVTSAWIEHQLETEPPSVPPTANFIPFTQEVIYRRWLAANWIDNDERFRREWSRPVLPPELNLSLMNSRKMTFEGRFLLQINDITDISRALVYDEMPEDDLYDYDDFVELPDPEEDEEDPTIAELLTKNDNTRGGKRGRGRGRGHGKKAAPPPPPPKKKNPPGPPPAPKPPKPAPWESGKRMFQLELTDGHSTTLAIEYETIGVLRANLAGAKILLIGPFDVYMGTILLRPANLELLTDGIPPDSTPPPPPPPPPTVAPLAQSVTTTIEPCQPPLTPPPTPTMLIRKPLSDLQFTNIFMDDDYNDSTIMDSVLDHNNNIITNMDIDKDDEAVVSSSSDAVKVRSNESQNVEEEVTGSGQMDDEMEKYFDGLQDEDLGEQFFV